MSEFTMDSLDSFLQSVTVMKETVKRLNLSMVSSMPKAQSFGSKHSRPRLVDDLLDITFTGPSRDNYNFSDTHSDKQSISPGSSSGTASIDWLLKQCQHYVRYQGSDLTPEELKDNLVSVLAAGSNDDELQSVLVDILGLHDFDFIIQLIQKRKSILEAGQSNSETKFQISMKKGNDYDNSNYNKSSYSNQQEFHLMSREEREQQLKDNERALKDPLPASSKRIQYPNVYRTYEAGSTLSAFGSKYALPVGTTRDEYGTYEEIVVPYPEKKPIRGLKERPVLIAELDGLCQGTFRGYESLNRMQSLVYPLAYHTNENLLVCAPTGAGKTDVAMLTVLHTIKDFCDITVDKDGIESYSIRYDDFKIVYVAPLKALASEVVEKMGKRLAWLGISVKELTGDMQLTKTEIMKTQMIVTTPEKWDVVTRKGSGDNELVQKVKLLIIDEVHLLHEDRGAVIESLVARTLRQVESSQSMIRIVGLSATLPNFQDVAEFLRVNPMAGLFFFDASFRPVPLKQHFIGVKGKAGSRQATENIDKVAYDKLVEQLAEGHQVMIFVHSRKDTAKTARNFGLMSDVQGDKDLLYCQDAPQYDLLQRDVAKSKNKDIKELFAKGFGIHHAGLLRSDRNLTEKLFLKGAIKVLVCTATLAWGVNLPAAVVIIKGTQVYDAKKGGFVDLGISDVIQIFGRAGRPQFEKFGTGILCTTGDRLSHFITAVTEQHPIESKLQEQIVDNLNAEISLGTVTNIDEGVQWLGYTYLYVRMRKNPLAYGLTWNDLIDDPLLGDRRRTLIITAARRLHKVQMIIFDENVGTFISKDTGRVASDFYLLNNSVEIFNALMKPLATEADVFAMISVSSEFDNIRSRDEEHEELVKLKEESAPCQVAGTTDTPQAKTNILIQSFISKARIQDSSLTSDAAYVAQNATRICRALFQIAVNRKWGHLSRVLLSICLAIEKRMWSFQHPLSQFDLPEVILRNLEAKNPSIEELRDMDISELGDLVHNMRMGGTLARHLDRFPTLHIDTEIAPITRNVLKVHVNIEPEFIWDDRYHGKLQFFWIWVEDSEKSEILHVEKFILAKQKLNNPHTLDFTIPLADPLPAQIFVRAISDSWVGAMTVQAVSFQHLIRPENDPIQTKLLKLQPLPISALKNPKIENIYAKKFQFFNPMQSMIFHCLYHMETNVFLGSPTGSGKTVAAELAIWSAFNKYPKSKVVYIAPMKALVRERVLDWRDRICKPMGRKLVELTGDNTPDSSSIRNADIIITTPEKFDGISRNWKTRKFVQQVSLVIMDEIHLLASDRGPILEMIVSRMNYVAGQTKQPVRLLGMSTAVSNTADMAGWLGVKEGIFNFPSSVRPVPLQMYIDGFPDNLGFSPLMKTMNKPAFMAIKSHSPEKPVLVFVASRRQTRMTALDLIHLCGNEDNPRRFLKMDENELEMVLSRVSDETLKLSLQFGIALHHAGLVDSDRTISHELFANNKVQILIATSTLAWGVNLPAHLVVIKGTQFFDAKIEAYRDMDLTDILQMMGRAGRPGYDTSGTAMVFTKESKKQFYKHFLNVGFPVESSLHKVLDDHLGAEIASGTIKSKQDALEFLTWTFLFRRVHNNPSYYGLEDASHEGTNQYFINLVNKSIKDLQESGCLEIKAEENIVSPTPFLRITSYYYLSHKTIRNFLHKMKSNASFKDCLMLACEATEYDELPVRHNEDLVNIEISKEMRYPGEHMNLIMWDPHVKAFLLLQAYMSGFDLPIADYLQDTLTVLDQFLRILQAAIDTAAELGLLSCALSIIKVMQCIKQGYWFDDDPVTALPGLSLRSLAPKKSPIIVKDDEVVSEENTTGFAEKSQQELADTTAEEVVKKVSAKNESAGPNKKVTTLKDVGMMTSGQLRGFMRRLNVTQEKEKDFLRIASSLPVVDIEITKLTLEGTLEITLNHRNEPLDSEYKMYTPKFHKKQKESWFVVLGSVNSKADELFTLKRISPKPMRGKQDTLKSTFGTKISIPEEMQGKLVKMYIINDAVDIEYVDEIVL